LRPLPQILKIDIYFSHIFWLTSNNEISCNYCGESTFSPIEWTAGEALRRQGLRSIPYKKRALDGVECLLK